MLNYLLLIIKIEGEKMENFKDEDFESKIKNEPIAVVQFSASWCSPCKVLRPVMEKLSVEYKDKMKTFYADIESDALNLGSQCGIRGVPTLILFKKGVEVDRLVGGVPENTVREFLDKSV
tara:strand:+ start:232 stop:591 length:360 start_codon:yes stop_codon:yes gene_type:complete